MKPLMTDFSNSPWLTRLQHKMDRKTKPLGALGRLETLAIQIGVVFETDSPVLLKPQLFVFAGDHGLAQHGVSAYPSDVTWQMVLNFIQGGAAVSVLAKQHHMDLHVVDCGVNHTFDSALGVLDYKIANGTADCLTGPAMSASQCQKALENGQDLIQKQPGNVILLGEMGIGNTSSASLIMSRLTHTSIESCTGAGTGLTPDAVKRKQGILAQALAANPEALAPLDVLAAFGGFEIATMVGAVLAASAENRVIVVDGFIASAAVLVAASMVPTVLQRCVFAHCSGEKGHAHMLDHLGVQPLLNLDLRLGEGSGAALAWPLLVSACAILREMASFESAGVSQQTTPSSHS